MVDVDENKAMAEVANFCSKEDFFSMEFLWASASTAVSPTAWWTGLCRQCELSKIASKILSLPATSASCERSFSAQANVHSKKRNRLTNEHTEKLLFVAQNLKLVAPVSDLQLHQPSSTSTTSYSKRTPEKDECSSSDTESQSEDSDMISLSSRISYDDESGLPLEGLTRMSSDEPESE